MPTAPPDPTSGRADLGVVAIGRNEGERLRACLASAAAHCRRAVYVDSGSTDGSVALARACGAEVVELDLRVPFTAAHARNQGWRKLASLHPELRYVQFVDGDCELDAGWLATASRHLDAHPRLAVVCGRRRERDPDASVYNRLCDVEWDTPSGPALACGGDALMRIEALREVDGFDDALIAGEEPELCFRLRARDWGIERLPVEMTRHDAAMQSWRQWWRRCHRAGHAFANGAHLHRASPERYYRAEVRSILLWGLGLPAAAVAAAALHPLGALLLLAYPAQWWRLTRRHRAAGRIPPRDCGLYALSCLVGKFANLVGVVDFHYHRLRGRTRGLIEYK
jgi:GT2 family glycosyltransferase